MFSRYEEDDVAADLFGTLDQIGTVYGEDPDPDSGRYTVVLKARLECRLQPLTSGIRFAPSSGDRKEELAFRFLYWRRDYSMPEQCQVEIDGVRHQPEAGTFQAIRSGNSGVLLNRCSVLRQQVDSF